MGKKVIIIDFNPWYNNSPESIITEYFTILKNELGKYSSLIEIKLSQYIESISKVPGGGFHTIASELIRIKKLNRSTKELYNEIDDLLIKIGKKVIIFIDDLDRLDKNEVFEVIRLIRNTASFSSCIYIVSYERNYILNALKYLNVHNYHQFLEKIFSIEVTLPQIDPIALKQKLVERLTTQLTKIQTNTSLSDTLPKTETDKLEKEISDIIFNNESTKGVVLDIVKNIRDVTRLSNSIAFVYSFLKHEVEINDLFGIELLKLKFPEIHKLIYEKKDAFFIIKTVDSTKKLQYYLYEKNSDTDTSLYSIHNFSQKKQTLKEYISDNKEQFNLNNENIKVITEIIERLFMDDISLKGVNAINYVRNFDVYFSHSIFSDVLSNKELVDAFKLELNDLNKKIEAWIVDGKGLQFGEKFLEIVSIKNKSDFEKTLKSLLFALNSSNTYNLIRLFTSKIEIILGDRSKKRIAGIFANDKELKELITNTFKCITNHPYIGVSYYISERIKNLLYSIEDTNIYTLEELQELNLYFLNTYLNSKNQFDNNCYQLYYLDFGRLRRPHSEEVL